jgi:hypothetical protein
MTPPTRAKCHPSDKGAARSIGAARTWMGRRGALVAPSAAPGSRDRAFDPRVRKQSVPNQRGRPLPSVSPGDAANRRSVGASSVVASATCMPESSRAIESHQRRQGRCARRASRCTTALLYHRRWAARRSRPRRPFAAFHSSTDLSVPTMRYAGQPCRLSRRAARSAEEEAEEAETRALAAEAAVAAPRRTRSIAPTRSVLRLPRRRPQRRRSPHSSRRRQDLPPTRSLRRSPRGWQRRWR